MSKHRVYSFEKLKVWPEIRLLIIKIYEVSQTFPAEERYGLTSQIRRAAVSIASNVAEGAGRSNQKEQKQFYKISYASLMEVLSQLIISVDLDYFKEDRLNDEIRPLIEDISSKLYGLKK